jgi:DNA polymerase beta
MKKQDSEGEEEEEEEEEVSKKKKKHLHRRIDLRVIPYENYYCGLLYFTGTPLRTYIITVGFFFNVGCTEHHTRPN